MINVVWIGNDSQTRALALKREADFFVHQVLPSSIEQVIVSVANIAADIFVLDASSSDLNTELLSHFLYEAYPRAKSIIITDRQPSFDMLQQSGFKVRGYITENQLIDIAKAVRVVSEGEAWLPRKLVAEMLNHFETA
jgi:DNA-binding NarL/FixJ family response regulator